MRAEKPASSTGMTWALAVLGGFLIGTADASFGGFLIGVVLGVLLAQVLFLRTRVRQLDVQLTHLQSRSLETSRPDGAPSPVSATASVEEPPVEQAPAPIEMPAAGEPTAPVPARPASDSPRRQSDLAERAFAWAWSWLRRGNPLARIGVVVLFFGAVFLARYAADHALFPLELRFVALAAGALALLIVGWRLRTRRPAYAEVLQGGGIAGLYLTVFAAASLYPLLPLGLAFGLMVAIAFASAVLALAQRALALAVIGTAGGFLAPVLVSTGSGNHIALFTYYAILNLGIFAIAWFRTWRVLNVLGFAFTFVITGLWRATGYTPDELVSADAFLILFFLMYVGVSILNCVRQPPNLKGYLSGALVFGLPVVAFTLHGSLVADIEYALAYSALALAVFYLALAYTLLRFARPNWRLLIEAFAALGVIFASLAIPLAFETRTTAAMWAVEGAGLIWLGVRQQRKLARAFGALLQAAAGLSFLLVMRIGAPAPPFVNTTFLAIAMLSLAGLFSGLTLYRSRGRAAAYERGASEAFAFWGIAWWLGGGMIEIDRWGSQWSLGAALAYVAASCFMLARAGTRLSWRTARLIALFLSALAGAVGLLAALDTQHPFGAGGAPGWAVLIAVFYWMLYRAERESLASAAHAALHAGAAWMCLLLAAWELSWRLQVHAAGVWPALPWGWMPTIALALSSRSVLVPHWPIAQHAARYRTLIAAPLAIVAGVWIIVVNATNVGDPLWLPYLPLLNPLDVSTALALAAGGLWWTALEPAQRARLWQGDLRVLMAMLAVIVFWWLNAALLRSLHHNFGAPITWQGMARSQLVQAALSIFWALLGFTAMTLAARRHWRVVWMVGAVLMLVVVAKLFLVDLSNVGTIARIVSFLTIGALIVITGYLAPLPPRARGDATASGTTAESSVTS